VVLSRNLRISSSGPAMTTTRDHEQAPEIIELCLAIDSFRFVVLIDRPSRHVKRVSPAYPRMSVISCSRESGGQQTLGCNKFPTSSSERIESWRYCSD
jgi:hypothetical protein